MLVLWSRKDTYRRFINSMGIQAVSSQSSPASYSKHMLGNFEA